MKQPFLDRYRRYLDEVVDDDDWLDTLQDKATFRPRNAPRLKGTNVDKSTPAKGKGKGKKTVGDEAIHFDAAMTTVYDIYNANPNNFQLYVTDFNKANGTHLSIGFGKGKDKQGNEGDESLPEKQAGES